MLPATGSTMIAATVSPTRARGASRASRSLKGTVRVCLATSAGTPAESGTPRVANRLLRRVRDYAQVKADNVITRDVALDGLARLEVDALGLDSIDHMVLSSIVEKFDGGPVGLDTLAASISEEAETIEDVYEPYLLQLGFLDRTPRGRVATRRAYEHLGVAYTKDKPATAQTSMFE